jgi:hypothetical protein
MSCHDDFEDGELDYGEEDSFDDTSEPEHTHRGRRNSGDNNNEDTFGVDPLMSDPNAGHGVDPGDRALKLLIDSFSEAEGGNSSLTTGSNNNGGSVDKHDSFLESLAAEVKQGPALHSAVAKLVDNHLSRDFRRSGGSNIDITSQTALVVKKFRNYSVPSNLEKIKSCIVNDSVYKAMTPSSKRANGDLQLVEAAVCKSMTAQAMAMQELAELRKSMPKNLSDGFQSVFRRLADSVEFGAFARAKTNESRRDTTLACLNSNYKPLISNTSPENGLLFGQSLETAIRSVETSNKLSQKLTAPTKSFSKPFLGGRGRGRGRSRQHYNPSPRGGHSSLHQPYPHSASRGKSRG